MEKTIRCPECGDNITPEFGMCPVCSYKFRTIDYMQQGMKEEDFTELKELKLNPAFFGKLKVIGFVLILVIILLIFLNR